MEQQQVSSAICSSVLVHIKHQGSIREKRMIRAKKTQNLGETEKNQSKAPEQVIPNQRIKAIINNSKTVPDD